MATPADIFSMLPTGGADPFARLTLDDLLQTVMREGQSVIASDPTSPLPLATEDIPRSREFGLDYDHPTANPAYEAADLRRAAPNSSATPAPATAPAVRAASASTQPPQRGMMDQLNTFLAGLKGGDGAILPALGSGARAVQGENATIQALASRGVAPEMIQAAIANPAVMTQVLGQVFRPRTQTLAPGARLIDDQGRTIANNTDNFAPIPEGGGVFNRSTGEVTQGGTPRAPAGFEWVDPSDRSKGLRAIAGGPATHISAEVAGRLAAMRTARSGLEQARTVYQRAWTSGDWARHAAANLPGVGDLGVVSDEIGRAQREVRSAIEAALRTMTGAAAPEQEVRRYMDLYMPNARDDVTSAKQKLDNLDNFMAEAERLATQGRTATPAPHGNQNADGWREVAHGVRIRERR